MNKLKALIQWFVQLELQEHSHWCTTRIEGHWMPHRNCKGVFCSGKDDLICDECKSLGRLEKQYAETSSNTSFTSKSGK